MQRKKIEMQEHNIYEHSKDNKYRYALGRKQGRILFCLGLNPSTATKKEPDKLITKMNNIVKKNIVKKEEGKAKDFDFGEEFDSFVMLNIYPLRETDPDKLPKSIDNVTKSPEHIKNVECILSLVDNNSVIWAAWGHLDRTWLRECLNDIIAKLQEKKKNIRWIKMGYCDPPHPSRVKYQPFTPYDVNAR